MTAEFVPGQLQTSTSAVTASASPSIADTFSSATKASA